MRQDYRLLVCARCRAQVAICSHCDRGQRYCEQGCAQAARRESLRVAGRRYQATFQGRLQHAARQARYRQRQQQRDRQEDFEEPCVSLPGGGEAGPPCAPPSVHALSVSADKVTHQGTQAADEWSRLAFETAARWRITLSASRRWVRCSFCGARCRPYARLEPLRCRR